MQFTTVHLIVIGAIALVVIAGIVYLIADNRAHKRRMYESASRHKKAMSRHTQAEEVG